MKLKYKLCFNFCLIVLLLLVSCQSESELIIATTSSDMVTDATISQPTLDLPMTLPSLPATTEIVKTISAPSPSPTVSVTIDSEIMTLSPPLATPTVIAATLTPLPVLKGEELESSITKLLENPMNCDVPCWWGAIPGVTSINEIKHTISPYNFDINEYFDEEGNVYIRLGIKYVEDRNGFEVRIVYSFSDSILTDVTAYSPPISDSLVKYGQPDEVWISAKNDIRQQPPLIRFAIVYLQEGVGIGYVIHGEFQDAVVRGCFANEKTGELRLVTPDSATSYKDFSTIFSKETLYLPLEEATDLTIEEFTQLFSDPSQPQCIDTPRELWE